MGEATAEKPPRLRLVAGPRQDNGTLAAMPGAAVANEATPREGRKRACSARRVSPRFSQTSSSASCYEQQRSRDEHARAHNTNDKQRKATSKVVPHAIKNNFGKNCVLSLQRISPVSTIRRDWRCFVARVSAFLLADVLHGRTAATMSCRPELVAPPEVRLALKERVGRW